jgi:predicted nucleic acid-binding protein
MSALVFVDTSVLIYARDQTNVQKQKAAADWLAELWKSRSGRISFQVLQESYVKVSQKWPTARDEARADVRDLLAWRPAAVDAAIFERGWKVQDRYGLSFWDALIVAAAKSAACQYLLSEDLRADQDLDGVVVVNPFLREPSFLRSCASGKKQEGTR